MNQALVEARPAQAELRRADLLSAVWLACYAIFGLSAGTTGSLLEEVRRTLDLGEGLFGTALLVTPLVGLGFLLTSGRTMGRVARRTQLLLGLAGAAGALLILSLARDFWTLLPARALAGLGYALMESSMNSAALDLERATGRRIVGTLYAVFSAGLVAAALISGGLLSLGWTYRAIVVALTPLYLLAGIATALLWRRSEGAAADYGPPGRLFTLLRNRGYVVLLALCLLGVVSEAIGEFWSVIYIRGLGAAALVGSAAFALFSGAMIVGRAANASIVGRWGARASLRLSAVCLALAAMVLLAGGALAGLAAFALLGLGVAGVVPTVLSTAAHTLPRDTAMAANGIIATTYLGFVLAPPLVGWAAELFGMQPVLVLCLGAAAAGMLLLARQV